MNKDMYVDEYKIVSNKNKTLLMISTNINAKINKNISLSFDNVSFKINLEDNGNLETLKKLKSIILIITDEVGDPKDFMELKIKDIN